MDASHTSAAAPGSVVGFFHAGVTVSDMERSLRFYRDGLGFEVASLGVTGGPQAEEIWNMQVADVKVCFLKVPGSDTMVELFEFEEIERHSGSTRPCDYGAGHFCLFVDDADAVYARLHQAGFRARGKGPIEIRRGPHAGAKAVYVKDPDGYHVELYQRAPKAS